MDKFRNELLDTDYKILCLGLIQSLFEGSMYTFVLEWTPALTPAETSVTSAPSLTGQKSVDDDTQKGLIPHGYIFAGFMVSYASLWVC